MTTGKPPIHAKNLYYYVFLFLALAAAVYLVFTITGFQMNYLSYLLYDKAHLSAVYRLLNTFVLRKLLLSVLFLLLALIMLYLFYFSYYQLTYLKLSLLCVLSIPYCLTLTETDTIFFIGTASGQLWQNAGLISCVFLLLFFLYLSFDAVLARWSFPFILISTIVYGGLSLFMGFRRYSANVNLLAGLFFSIAALSAGLAAYCLIKKQFRALLDALPVLAGIFYLLAANYLYRLHNYSIPVINRRTALYNATLYVELFLSLYLLCLLLVRKRGSLMHSRELNRKIRELDQSKYMLLGTLYSNVKNYLFSARTSLDSLEAQTSLADSAKRDANCIRAELANIDALYNQIHNYTIFSGNSLQMRQVPINTNIFCRLFAERLDCAGLLSQTDSVTFTDEYGFVDLCPEYLLQSMEDLIILLKQQNPRGYLTLRSTMVQNQFTLSVVFSFPGQETSHTSRHISPAFGIKRRRMLPHPEYSPMPDISGLDFTLSGLRHQAASCGGQIKIAGYPSFRLDLSLPVVQTTAPAYAQNTFLCRNGRQPSVKHILILTSDALQMEQLRKMLPFDHYHITLANDADFFMEHPQELDVFSLVIVGNLYRQVYFLDFYDLVRRHYPMTALPILMLLPDLYAENSFYLRSAVNDYLIPPYSQVSLEKKIDALVAVKKTADIALEAQLEFWQSQINPHFIFNSINSIMHMCIKEPMKAYELLDDFSEYLRGHLLSLSLNRAYTIQKEINLISAYLQIEKARFPDKIHYELDVDCAEDFPILPLLIEPLIENSIKHSPMHETGVAVNVQIYEMENQLIVRVADNGNGMSPEMIRKILSDTYESNSIGLSNVCSRLRHYYRTLPTIESEPNAGTTVQFIISRETAR